jgi:sterol 3beta-glucosyltransferase
MEPFDQDHPCDFRITFETAHLGSREFFFSVDNEQSAAKWRKSLEAALYRHARHKWRENMAKAGHRLDGVDGPEDWTTMRSCLPLDRVTIKGLSDYHGFVTLVGLDVSLDGERVEWRPEDTAAGDYSGRIYNTPSKSSFPKSLFHRHSSGDRNHAEDEISLRRSHSDHRNASTTSEVTAPPSPSRQATGYIDTVIPPHLANSPNDASTTQKFVAPDGNSYEFNVAVLNEQAWFAEALQSAVGAAHERNFKQAVTRPKMKLEIAGFDCLATDEDVEQQHQRNSASSDDAEDRGHSLTKDMRKAEKGAMAAKVFGLKEDEPVYRKWAFQLSTDDQSNDAMSYKGWYHRGDTSSLRGNMFAFGAEPQLGRISRWDPMWSLANGSTDLLRLISKGPKRSQV